MVVISNRHDYDGVVMVFRWHRYCYRGYGFGRSGGDDGEDYQTRVSHGNSKTRLRRRLV